MSLTLQKVGNMKQIRVYDLPTRIFHWIFASLFLSSFVIAKTADDDSLVFSYHMLSGLVLLFVLICRFIWGCYGTRHAKFKNFDLRLKNLIDYFIGFLKNSPYRWAGHNPASSWIAIMMFSVTIALGVTGLFMLNGLKEELEDVHELLANGFLSLVIIHISGIVIHTIRHKDFIGLSMLSGNKNLANNDESSVSNRSAVGLIFLLATIGFAFYLNTNFNKKTRELIIFGTQVNLGYFPCSIIQGFIQS
jgi:cytochrome b